MRLRLLLPMLAACSFAPGRYGDGDGQPIGDDDGPTSQLSKRKPITIDRTRVGKTGAPMTLAMYPFLYSVVDPDLATTQNSGDVTDAEGDDIVFKDSAGTPLAHELESYDPATGRLVAWVKLPSLDTITSAANTTIYIYYGDKGITTSTQQPALVWDDAFEGVWHLNESPTATPPQMSDRTAHARAGTALGTTAVEGIVAGALTFDGLRDAVRIGTWTQFTNKSFTLEVWMRPETTALGQEVALSFHNANTNQKSLHLRIYSDGGIRFSYFGQDLDLPPGTVAMGQWHHFVATYNSAGDASRIYLAGAQAAMGNQGPFNAPDGAGAIGAWDGCSPCDQFFKGRIDEVRVSNVERSVHWISTVYANLSSPSTFATTGPAENVP